MSTDCSVLAEMATEGNFANYKNVNNQTLDTIWLNEDFTALFNKRYWASSEFLIAFMVYMICSFILIPVIFFYLYPKYDTHKRLTFYLQRSREKTMPSLRVHIRKLFHIHTKQPDNIIDIILDFGDFQLLHKDMKEYLDSYCESSFSKQKVARFSLCVWLIISISYFTVFHITVHCVDSYRSYAEIPCIIATIDDGFGDKLDGNCLKDDNDYMYRMGKQCVAVFNFEQICMPDTINLSNYVIYADRGRVEDGSYTVYNYIPTDCRIQTEYFGYRQPTETCCGCCSDCGRCNDCCNFIDCCWCFGACDTNACAYCACVTFVVLPLLSVALMMILGSYCFNDFRHDWGYQIHRI